MTIHQNELLASINRTYAETRNPELQRALNELSAATTRAVTLSDIDYLRGIFYDVRLAASWSHGVAIRMSSASLRLERLRRRH